ncbi:MAG: hypothetical protein IV100_24665 [Myxococcales bacterium]|nr:hypothetical protein [Myxococcales bacterium]
MSIRFVSGSVGFLVLVAAPMASAACYRDTECPGSQVCLALECQEPETPLNKCGEDWTDAGSDGGGTDGGSTGDGGTTDGAVPPPQCAGNRVCVDDYCKEPDVHCGNEFGDCYVGVTSYSCSCDGGGSDGGGTGGDVGSDALPAPTDDVLYATCLTEVALCEAATDGVDGSTTDGVDVGSDATDASTGSGDDVGSDATDGSTDSGGDVGSDGGSDSSTDGSSDGSTGATDGGGDDGGGDAADATTGGEADGGGTGGDASSDGAGDDGPSGDTAGDAADGATGTPSSSTASTGCTLGGAAASPACLLILGAFGLLRRRRAA